MKPTIILSALAAMTALVSQPAAAYPIKTTGKTLASPQLAVDLLRQIQAYSKTTGGCAFVFSAHNAGAAAHLCASRSGCACNRAWRPFRRMDRQRLRRSPALPDRDVAFAARRRAISLSRLSPAACRCTAIEPAAAIRTFHPC